MSAVYGMLSAFKSVRHFNGELSLANGKDLDFKDVVDVDAIGFTDINGIKKQWTDVIYITVLPHEREE